MQREGPLVKIIDISRDTLTSPVYPGDPMPTAKILTSLLKEDLFNTSAFSASSHAGTHIDAPLHCYNDGLPINALELDLFFGECTVVEVPEGIITGEYVERRFPRCRSRILIRGNGRASLHETAANQLVHQGVRLIGIDSMSIAEGDSSVKAHRILLSAGVPIIEGLDLSAAQAGSYFLSALPLKLGGLEAAPVRAVLISDHIFWSTK